jgi:hypothetical protein
MPGYYSALPAVYHIVKDDSIRFFSAGKVALPRNKEAGLYFSDFSTQFHNSSTKPSFPIINTNELELNSDHLSLDSTSAI